MNGLFYYLNKPMLAPEGAAGGGEPPAGGNGEKPPEGNKQPEGEGNKGGEPSKEGEKKYTDKEVDEIINKKFAAWESKKQKEMDEAKKLAEMNATEKANYERDKAIKEAKEIKNKLSLYDMSRQARTMLSEKNINVSDDLLGMLVSADAEETKKRVDGFVNMFNTAVDTAVKEKLKGKAPGGGAGAKTMTKDEIMAIKDRQKRQQAIKDNMELFE